MLQARAAIPRVEAQQMKDLGLLVLRATTGGLMAGHGAQKLFGVFGGYGLQGTAGWLESLGLKPGQTWALLAGGGGVWRGTLAAPGAFHPLRPLSLFGALGAARANVAAGQPIWVAGGWAALP